MGLGLSINSGVDFTQIIKYDARAGRMHRIDRVQGSEATSTEITQGFIGIFDMANVEIGWVLFEPNAAPDWHLVKIGQPKPQRPSEKHKQCFRVHVKLSKASGGDVRELGSAANCVIESVDELHNSYEAAPESKQGMLPVVALVGTEQIKSGSGAKASTNYKPKFEIKSWVKRPDDLGGSDAVSVPSVQANPAKQAPQTSVSDDAPIF